MVLKYKVIKICIKESKKVSLRYQNPQWSRRFERIRGRDVVKKSNSNIQTVNIKSLSKLQTIDNLNRPDL